MDSVIIENVKGIKHIEYNLPSQKGVYLLTGENGAGKTTLLAAINRIGDKFSFKANFTTEQSPDASFTYNIAGKTVRYTKGKERWVPSPKNNSIILNEYKYHSIYYLTATGKRLYQQETHNLSKTKHNVSEDIKKSLNRILNTDKFSNLQYIKVKPKKGRQQNLHRDNKLYVLKNNTGKIYSELSFSLGEQLLLNALDYIQEVSNNSMLIIDEIELALHPIAQIRFYEYLMDKAKEKDLAIIISTHSCTLIKKAKHVYYLENNNGHINVIYPCKPAYILKDLSIEEDNMPDKIILVEDNMARTYLNTKIKYLRNKHEECLKTTIKILPVGGYPQVLSLFENLSAVQPFSKAMIHCLLDNDVQQTIKELRLKDSTYDNDKKMIGQFDRLANHYDYLSITPELGVWNELKQDCCWFEQELTTKYGNILFPLSDLIQKIDTEEKESEERKRAKGCIKSLYRRLQDKLPELAVETFEDLLMESYISHKWSDGNYQSHVKKQILSIIHKK